MCKGDKDPFERDTGVKFGLKLLANVLGGFRGLGWGKGLRVEAVGNVVVEEGD